MLSNRNSLFWEWVNDSPASSEMSGVAASGAVGSLGVNFGPSLTGVQGTLLPGTMLDMLIAEIIFGLVVLATSTA